MSNNNNSTPCLLQPNSDMPHFQPQAEDILTDEDLLELFRIIKQIIRNKPDAERVAKLFFCIVYAMGDLYQFYKPIHSDVIIFRDDSNINAPITADVQVPSSTCCPQQSQVPQRLLSVSYLTNPTTTSAPLQKPLPQIMSKPLPPPEESTSTDQYSVRPYTNIRPLYPSSSSIHYQSPTQPWLPLDNEQQKTTKYPNLNTLMNNNNNEVLMEPKQRGFYYQDGRITREPALLQRYAEQGVLTQASLMRKRKKNVNDSQKQGEYSYELATLPAPSIKKPKIPHRHGEFKQRRDDIISRMRTIMMADLEQKAQKLPLNFSLGIEQAELPANIQFDSLTPEEASSLLQPALRILTLHSNMKPHLDNGMNQNGIYYNNDYYRLYLAFVQFQSIFAKLFPNEIIKISTPPPSEEADSPSTMSERDKDRERNANMKAYRTWIEPFLTETNWAAFRRNIMVGERIMQLTKIVGQGVLLMTKELSGSKLHLTFTNNEWEEFINGLKDGIWDETIDWSHEDTVEQQGEDSLLVSELKLKFATPFWFTEAGNVVPPAERKALRLKERQLKQQQLAS